MASTRVHQHMTPDERFWARVEKTDTCWLWTGSGGRYGSMMVNRVQLPVHRWAYERFVGPIPEGLQIDHACGITRCVNPDHLRPMTPGENVRAHWREQRGVCRSGLHEMTPENTVWRQRGTIRKCRICDRERWRRYTAKKKAV